MSAIEGRARSTASLLAVLGLIASLAIAAPAASVAAPGKATAKRQASGAYAVGMRSFTFVDRSRPTEPNGTYPGAPARTLPTLLLYPAKGDPNGPALENARPMATRKRFPLVVFSHGVGANGPAYRSFLQQLARTGYVVALPTYPLSNNAAPGGSTIAAYRNQPADVSFIVTRMLRVAHRRTPLGRIISRHHIGAGGHSLGAITTLGVATNSCCVDRRIDAAVAWSGIQLAFLGTWYSTPTPPLLLAHGTLDPIVSYVGSTSAYDQAPAPKALVTLERAGHVPLAPPYFEPLIRSTADWFDAYLKRDRGALQRLAVDANRPGVATLRSSLSRSTSP